MACLDRSSSAMAELLDSRILTCKIYFPYILIRIRGHTIRKGGWWDSDIAGSVRLKIERSWVQVLFMLCAQSENELLP